MTEEELAAELGLVQTEAMLAMRVLTIRLAPSAGESSSPEFIETLSRYQQLGEEVVDRNNSNPLTQIALILLSASIRRDISRTNSDYVEYRQEDLRDAQTYAKAINAADLAQSIKHIMIG